MDTASVVRLVRQTTFCCTVLKPEIQIKSEASQLSGDERMSVAEFEGEEYDELPSAAEFCLSIPLYRKFSFDSSKSAPFFGLENFEGALDCFCHECGRHSVFKRIDKPSYREHHHYRHYVFPVWFACSRDNSHKLTFVFRSHQGVLEKIGQYPSMADLDTPDLQKYRGVLGTERFRELIRGVGLASHGVGIGAFVYLRRVFESLIEEAKAEAAKETDWNEDAFATSRMDGKILLLKHYLPSFLVENRSLYGIMSVGVHTLSESDCLEAFPVVKLGIELILDELYEKTNRAKKVAEAGKNIAALGASLKKTPLKKPGI
jgi:hypothetical protein